MQLIDFFSDFVLTSDQQNAVEKLNHFLTDSSDALILRGFAGTGKTFLSAGLSKYLSAVNRTSVIMAPTGRAAMIVGMKTGTGASTIHRAIYNLDDIEDEDTSFRFRYKLSTNDHSLSAVFIVDESSMISDMIEEGEFFIFGSGRLLSDLIDFIGFDHRKGAKVIFMGDPAQLPPVSMNLSPALDVDYLRSHFGITIDVCDLSEVVRHNEGSKILSLATNLRSSLEEKILNRFEIADSDNEIKNINRSSAIDAYFDCTAGKPAPDTIIITYSNRQALDYNLEIRKRVFRSEGIEENDVLIQTRNNYNYPVDLYNGMFVKVLKSGSDVEQRQVHFYIKGGEKKSVTFFFRDVVIEVHDFSGNMYVIRCKMLDNFLNSAEGRLSPLEQRALYVDFKKQHPLLKPGTPEFRDNLRKDEYFNALQAKYGYAITCHKAQGGEWNNVLVDFKLPFGKTTQGYFRWSYTAVTRAKKRLIAIDATEYGPLTEYIIGPVEKLTRVPQGAYIMPVVSSDDSDDETWKKHNFLKARYLFISKLADDNNVDLSVVHNSWVERYTFSQKGGSVVIDMYYGLKGFTGRFVIINSNNKEMEKQCLDFCRQRPVCDFEYIPPSSFQSELYLFIREKADEIGVCITNIINEPFCDRYFFETEADCAYLNFWYSQSGIYTHVSPVSTQGGNDIKLSLLVSGLQ